MIAQSLLAQLMTALLAIPGINDFDTRTSLLIGVPNYLSLNRNPTNPHTDISLLVDQLNHCTAPIRLDTNSTIVSECWSAGLAVPAIGFQTRRE